MERFSKRIKRIHILLTSIIVGLLFFVLFPYSSISIYVSNRMCKANDTLYGADYNICVKEPRIYFVETSFSRTLNHRQACAIESTARHNPDYPVTVIMTPLDSIDTGDYLYKLLQTISNVQLLRVHINKLTQGTPMENWYLLGEWKKSEFQVSHLSDSVRLFLLWKYGGVYLDLDIVTFRSLKKLKNSVIREEVDRVANGLLFFDKGHELMKRCMFDFADNYNYSSFAGNGPVLLTKNINALCDTNNITEVPDAKCDVGILPPEIAFPIHYDYWKEYFTPSLIDNVSNHFKSSYLIHVWNTFSKHLKVWIGSNSLYEKAMMQNCPLVYKHAQKIGFL